MPVEMTWEFRGVYSRFFGAVTAADLLNHVLRVCQHPDFGDLRFSVLDFREAKDEVNDADLFGVQANLIGAQMTNSSILVAAITTDPGAIDHLNRFIALGVLHRKIGIFGTPEAAMDWIAEQTHVALVGR